MVQLVKMGFDFNYFNHLSGISVRQVKMGLELEYFSHLSSIRVGQVWPQRFNLTIVQKDVLKFNLIP